MPRVIVNPPQNQAALAALQAQIDALQDEIDSVAAGGVLIDEATRDSDFTTTSTTGAEITGLSVVVPASEVRPVRITFTAPLGNSSAALTGGVRLVEDGVDVTDGVLCGVGDKFAPIYGEIILPPPSAEHTYNVEGYNASAGTLTLKAGSGPVDMALRAWRA